jgi:hypothetical protein
VRFWIRSSTAGTHELTLHPAGGEAFVKRFSLAQQAERDGAISGSFPDDFADSLATIAHPRTRSAARSTRTAPRAKRKRCSLTQKPCQTESECGTVEDGDKCVNYGGLGEVPPPFVKLGGSPPSLWMTPHFGSGRGVGRA